MRSRTGCGAGSSRMEDRRMIEQHYSCRQLAAKLGVSHGTVHKFVTEGRIGSVSFGHRILIPESAIVQYLETHRLGPAPTRRAIRPGASTTV